MRTEHGENNVVETGTDNAGDDCPSMRMMPMDGSYYDNGPCLRYYGQNQHNSVSDDCIYRNIHVLTSRYGSIVDLTMKQDNGTISHEERKALHNILVLESMLDPISDDEMDILMGESLEIPGKLHHRKP